jgi:two-component system, NarL family, response regulator YdfI
VIRVQILASAITRAGIESLLRASAAVELVTDSPDVVIVEDEAPADLAESGPPLIVLSDDPQWTAEALRGGVRAILPRELTAAEMLAAVEAAAAGLAAIPPRDLEALLPAVNAAQPVEPLSPREVEVLAMVAEGISNKEIAARLGISEHTVKFHVAQIMGKLRAGTRTEAVMTGVRMGLVMV